MPARMTIETCAMPIDGHAQSGSCTLGPGQSLHSQACASNQAQCLALRFVLLRAVFGARFVDFFCHGSSCAMKWPINGTVTAALSTTALTLFCAQELVCLLQIHL
jgi:hypothetical protein